MPSVEQVLMFPNDIDSHLMDVFEAEPVQHHDAEQVGQALTCLDRNVSDADKIAVSVARNLARQEQPIADDVRVAVVRCRRKPCIDLRLVHTSHSARFAASFHGR